MSNDNELVNVPYHPAGSCDACIEPPKRQWYVTEVGEYECPHYALTNERMTPVDKTVMLTDLEAANIQEIEALYQEQQGFLNSIKYPSHPIDYPRPE